MNSNNEDLKNNTNAIINCPKEEKNIEQEKENEKDPVSYEIVKKDHRKYKKVVIALIIIIVLFVCLFSVIFALLNIKNKYGKNAILKGMNLEKGATMMERNKQIGGHHE